MTLLTIVLDKVCKKIFSRLNNPNEFVDYEMHYKVFQFFRSKQGSWEEENTRVLDNIIKDICQ